VINRINGLIPTFNIAALDVEQVVVETPSGGIKRTEKVPSVTNKILEVCTVRPYKGEKQDVLPEGIRESDVVILRTNTKVRSSKRGTDKRPTQFSYDGGVYTVIKVANNKSNVINHYRAMAVLTEENKTPEEIVAFYGIEDLENSDPDWWDLWINSEV
jgi:hypothetical protein